MNIAHKRNDKLIRRKFYSYLIPGIIMVIALQFGSLADGIIVGNLLGPDALSATSLVLPIIYLSQLPGIMLAVGSSIVIANLLGKRNIEGASKVFKAAMMFAFLISLIFVPIGIFASDALAALICGDGFVDLVPFVAAYMKAYLIQAPIIGIGLVFGYCLTSDNHPGLSAAFFIIANVAHLGSLLAFCFLAPEDLRMLLAGFSVGIGMAIGFIILIPYLRSKKRCLQYCKGLKGIGEYIKPVLKSGATQGSMFILLAIYALVLNIAATSFLEDSATLATFAMMQNFAFLIDLFVSGILQIMPSLLGALFGEKDYFSVKKLAKLVFILAISVAAILTVVSEIYPDMFFYIFNVSMDAGKAIDPRNIIRIYCISFVLYTINKYIATYYPTIMVNAPGVVAMVIRNGVVGLPALYFLMMAMSSLGYCLGTIISEAAALVLSIVFVLVMKKLGKYQGKGLLLVPDVKETESVEFSFPCVSESVGEFAEELQGYAVKMSGDEIMATQLTVAAEEIIANVMAYGVKRKTKSNYIDVCLAKIEDKLVVRIRDDGVAFDPTSSEIPSDELSFSGIELVKKLSSDFHYVRMLNTNNTIIEVALKA